MTDIKEILGHIDPGKLDYQEWVNVGMALKDEGLSWEDWDAWSRKDIRRYHSGECERKWQSFCGSAAPVTAGTIVQYAKEQGWRPPQSSAVFDWNDEIYAEEDSVTIDRNASEGICFHEPRDWHPGREIIRYLETLFEASENVGYVTESWEKADEGKKKFLPTKGSSSKTAGELIAELNKHGDDIGAVLGDYNPAGGAWIRFNPLDGKGVKNENVTDFRYALVESDSMPLEEQNALIRELELPVAVLVYSGGKSIHAIVRIEAASYEEYRKRVDYLYDVCRKNGLEIDKQNRNPSRLSRMPGVIRGDKKQYIIDTNIGMESFTEWRDWIESINDDMPEPENLSANWDDLPELSPPLIDGVLRQGHKMLLAGPSKAGKSYALIELCVAIAEGGKWLGFQCAKGRIMYVNLELDPASCLHRFKDVYAALKLPPDNISNIDIWNLRGRSAPMDRLSPKLIRRAQKKDYIAIVIDPIYKIITGDENSADQMAHFCNQFDKVCNEVGCAVIYCHHHSKGNQGGKRSMDRASGSGVFARDPDALLDLTELSLPEALIKSEENALVCRICLDWIRRWKPEVIDEISDDDRLSPPTMRDLARKHLQHKSYAAMCSEIDLGKKRLGMRTAWRIEGTLREFASFPPVSCWFDYPVHREDATGALGDLRLEDEIRPYEKAKEAREKQAAAEKKSRIEKFVNAYNSLCIDSELPTMEEIATLLGTPLRTVRRWAKEAGYDVDKNNGKVVSKASLTT